MSKRRKRMKIIKIKIKLIRPVALSRATHWYTNEPGDDTFIDLINVVST